MICKYPNLESELKRQKIKIPDLVTLLECDEDFVRLKLAGILDWSLTDAIRICHALGASDLNILFSRNVQLDSNCTKRKSQEG